MKLQISKTHDISRQARLLGKFWVITYCRSNRAYNVSPFTSLDETITNFLDKTAPPLLRSFSDLHRPLEPEFDDLTIEQYFSRYQFEPFNRRREGAFLEVPHSGIRCKVIPRPRGNKIVRIMSVSPVSGELFSSKRVAASSRSIVQRASYSS